MSRQQQGSEAPTLFMSSPPLQPPFLTSSVSPSGKSGERWCLRRSHDELKASDVSTESKHSKLCARGHWRPAEDSKLKGLVAKFGPQSWNLIAENLHGRSGKSCRLRWFNQLDPRINRKAFTEEDEQKLLAAHQHYGNKWALISRFFPGRTDNAVKNHWHVIMARQQRERCSSYTKRKPSSSISSSPSPLVSNNIHHSTSRGESTTSSSREESVSTATDLSAVLFTPQQQKAINFFMGSVRNGRYEKVVHSSCASHEAGKVVVASARESEAIQRSRYGCLLMSAENEGEKMNLPFFDFLGVGTAQEKPLMVD